LFFFFFSMPHSDLFLAYILANLQGGTSDEGQV
jgi:hypothetical protein